MIIRYNDNVSFEATITDREYSQIMHILLESQYKNDFSGKVSEAGNKELANKDIHNAAVPFKEVESNKE